MNLVPEYCFGVQIEEYNRKTRSREVVIRDCTKADIENDVCHAHPNPCEKMGIARGGHIGCALSPLEAVSDEGAGKVRVGQQKQTKRKSRR